jgi:hypothetical protein
MHIGFVQNHPGVLLIKSPEAAPSFLLRKQEESINRRIEKTRVFRALYPSLKFSCAGGTRSPSALQHARRSCATSIGSELGAVRSWSLQLLVIQCQGD